jgi:hypothetical protein
MSPKQGRPSVLPGMTFVETTHCGKIFVTITHDHDKQPQEVFVRFGKAGGCASAIMDGVSRIVSYGLRSGLEPKDVIKGLAGIGCHHGRETCMNAVADAFRRFAELTA